MKADDFFLLSNEEKNIFLKTIDFKGKEKSLSNDVILFGELVIKKKREKSEDKRRKEVIVLNAINRRNYSFENILVIEKLDGDLIKSDEINDKKILNMLMHEVLNFSKNEVLIKDLPKVEFHEYLNSNKNYIKTYFSENGLSEVSFEKVINYLEKDNQHVVSHCDLNRNNLILNKRIYLIDFEDVKLISKYYNYCTLIANWDINIDNIIYICNVLGIDKDLLLGATILLIPLMIRWNSNMFSESGKSEYSNRIMDFKKKITELLSYTKITS